MQNKSTRYFKYAIGEIILVVIGILIALQINNWNENRKERQQEQVLLGQLQSEFQSNLDQLDQKIRLRDDMLNASLKILAYFDDPETANQDSLIAYLSITQMVPTFDPIVNDLVSSGQMQLIKNQVLKEKLARWTSEVVQVTEEEISWGNISANHFLPHLNTLVPGRTISHAFWENRRMSAFHLDKGKTTTFKLAKSKTNFDSAVVLNDYGLEGYIADCVSFSELTNIQSYALRERIVELLDIIKSELEP
ncbi:DUF6090 family protein [Winogradskyella maritima]|uniref:DUF6090 family protein n=1 Tax=Winogradskyella maritima TaxID=1517766 RepID=A0ABV8AKI8_9FLAO|nr:DUF6090 family protein [Winogradskyella maritima]